ncbi:MAG: cytochrome c biogenesis protein CcsA [Bacteroidetes bacterium]|nr:cytochrome c biogenesis protein CcsA [Bacteroidota bacterium]
MLYIGEHILPGLIGRIFVWTGFVSAILATLFFLVKILKKDTPGNLIRRSAKGFFLLHAFSLVSVAIILYYLIFRHYFEYSYVWEYSSKSLPFRYIISCFWAGQEGSFLIWAIFQALLGVILIFIAKDWKDHVMSVVSLSQMFVTSMMLGIKFGAIKIGTSPFTLLRDTMPTIQGTIFQQPDYLSSITDGNGLNPLLENIWMTIHPPILFLGYALALVPFAYAIAALLRKEYFSWIRIALPWTILSVAVLGAGILLGGAWAYVSLTFGGFWSWDPVENSSLVPWMTLIAGLHFMIIARKQQFAMFSAYLLIGLSYILVLYASFLTRSGVLANTSAHSFGDNGMTAQLLVFLLVFLVLVIVMIALNAKKFHEKKNENLLSREFWMFTGSVIIVLAAFQIIFTTSLPVINSLFHINIAPPSERIAFYNHWQTPFTLLIAGFIAFSQFLNYTDNKPGGFYRKMAFPFILSVAAVIPFISSGIVTQFNFVLFLFFLFFALISSLFNLVLTTSKPRNIGAIISHTGILLFLTGTLLTFSNSRIISTNTSRFDLGDTKTNDENLMMVKNDTLMIKEYYVVYSNKAIETLSRNLTYYQLDFLKRDEGRFHKEFTLFPSVNHNQRMGDVYNPDTRHFLTKDVYAYIAFVGTDPDYIVVKAIINPYINILWAGAVIMIAGFTYSFVRRFTRKSD